jgi:hypothetical protein
LAIWLDGRQQSFLETRLAVDQNASVFAQTAEHVGLDLVFFVLSVAAVGLAG